MPSSSENKLTVKTIAELRASYQEKLGTLKPGFPEMRNLQAQIDELQRQVDREIEVIGKSVEMLGEIQAPRIVAGADRGVVDIPLSALAQRLNFFPRWDVLGHDRSNVRSSAQRHALDQAAPSQIARRRRVGP